jgi:triosephosphate isomerase
MAEIVIAYEPVWAIGTGLNATPAQAQEMHAFHPCRKLRAKYSPEIAGQQVPILYGGSCKPDNAKAAFCNCPDVDGGLIGGASLKGKRFFGYYKGSVITHNL